jgi:hypothetical protein
MNNDQKFSSNLFFFYLETLSTNGSTMERSKRYSSMRNNMTNSIQQQASLSSQIQRSNHIEPSI